MASDKQKKSSGGPMKAKQQEKGLTHWKRRRWAIISSVAGVAALIAVSLGVFSGPKGEAVNPVVGDFTVDTSSGRYTFSEQRGKTLVYFFSFPG
ncbi:MAG: hypothetical protein O6934_12400 [SAR324 cluster bacterium]|nr:hypothetical protein [SAR324 cluster bacterium]